MDKRCHKWDMKLDRERKEKRKNERASVFKIKEKNMNMKLGKRTYQSQISFSKLHVKIN